MRRPDPFFAGGRPHTNGYLESLHRTYGEPVSALPKRDDAHFQRAYAFRLREKQHYSNLEEEHRGLQARYQELAAETAKIHALVEELSKRPKDGERPPDRTTSGNRERDVLVADKDAAKGVSEQVLHDGDVGGQADEHSAEGPESGGGTGSASVPAGATDGGNEGAE